MFIWGQFRLRYHSHQSLKLASNYFSKILLKSPRDQWVNSACAVPVYTQSSNVIVTVPADVLAHRIVRSTFFYKMPLAIGDSPILPNAIVRNGWQHREQCRGGLKIKHTCRLSTIYFNLYSFVHFWRKPCTEVALLCDIQCVDVKSSIFSEIVTKTP